MQGVLGEFDPEGHSLRTWKVLQSSRRRKVAVERIFCFFWASTFFSPFFLDYSG